MTVSVTTTRPINLGQLSRELGVTLNDVQCGDEHTISTVDPGTSTAQLQAAVDKHVPNDGDTPPTIDALAQQVADLQAQVAQLTNSDTTT